MRFANGLACLLLFLVAASPLAAFAQTQSFEELIEDTLKRDEASPPPDQPPLPQQQQLPQQQIPQEAPQPLVFPQEPQPAAPAQGLPPQLVPVEPGPRPYTPPKIERSPEEKAVRKITPPAGSPAAGSAADASESGEASATSEAAQEGAPSATDANAAPATERTRESLTVEEVNDAVLPAEVVPVKGADPLVLKVQVLLDRAGASPGAIDAYAGGNLEKAIAAVETVLGLPIDGMLDQKIWDALGGDSAPPVLVQYTITPDDLAYPFLAEIPADYAEQSRLPSLGYTSPLEMFGERFHMDTKLLVALNPNADFRQAGTADLGRGCRRRAGQRQGGAHRGGQDASGKCAPTMRRTALSSPIRRPSAARKTRHRPASTW